MLVPDNLKTGVDHTNDWYTPQINRTYRELSEHYNTAVVPARVRKPKDKSSAEGTVGVVSTRIIATLRNRKFFSLEELNRAIRQKLDDHSKTLFTKRECSRYSVFQSHEKAFLHKLPTAQFKLAQWKKIDLLIPDKWMLISLAETETREMLEIIHARHQRVSTIFCSQFAPAG